MFIIIIIVILQNGDTETHTETVISNAEHRNRIQTSTSSSLIGPLDLKAFQCPEKSWRKVVYPTGCVVTLPRHLALISVEVFKIDSI